MGKKKQQMKRARREKLVRIIVLAMVLAVGAVSLIGRGTVNLAVLDVGQPSPQTYVAQRDYRIQDLRLTELKRQQKQAEVSPVFLRDNRQCRAVMEALERQIDALRNDQKSLIEDLPLPQTAAEWQQFSRVGNLVVEYILREGLIKQRDFFAQFTLQDTGYLELIPVDSRGEITSRTEVQLDRVKDRWIILPEVGPQVGEVINNLYPGFNYRDTLVSLIEGLIQPNIKFRESRFERELETAAAAVDPVYHEFAAGEVVVEAGEVLTDEDYRLLEKINSRDVRFYLAAGLAAFFFLGLAVFFIYLYSLKNQPELLQQPNLVALLAFLIIITVVFAKFFQLIEPDLPGGFKFLFPLAALTILITILLNASIAFLIVPFIAFILVTYFNFSLELLALFILGGISGIFFSQDVEQRTTLLQTGLIITAVQVVSLSFIYLLRTGQLFSLSLGSMIFWSVLNGAVAVPLIVVGALPFLENGFGVTTKFKLQELADLSHPLLRELSRNARGTFQHSMDLSSLCEAAAREIGADPLLTRVGAYYHDIGKTENPEYFTENQGESNPHEKLKPTLSASILKSHVKIGIDKARQAGLPEVIIDFIAQHQGTTQMKSFYHKALENGEEPEAEEFRYPGPIPQSKEVAILMLGDACEAAARSLKKPNAKKIKEKVESIIDTRFVEGQLDQCELTLKDLNMIGQVFTRVLTSQHHTRVSYPSPEETEALQQAMAEDGEQAGESTEESSDSEAGNN